MLVQAGVQVGRLRAHATPTESDVFIICVPTPLTDDRKPELKYVRAATESICPYVREGNLVILESTSPPGTVEMIGQIIEQRTGLKPPQIFLAHAPERVLPGKILREVIENDRIIGGIDEASTARCGEFYKTFVTGELLLTNARTAECAKLVENAFRDVNIAFANELSLMAEELGVDVWELIRLANRHPRVNILSPGPGVGGHCIAVDPWFLVSCAPDVTKLIRTTREVNEAKPHWVVQRVLKRARRFNRPQIACLGLAYKPDIDDLRESPAVEIVRELKGKVDGDLLVVEPNLKRHEEFELMPVEAALARADIVLVLVAHAPFKRIAPKLLAEKTIMDVCGALRR
jgi:UDP-N-acetyl-D-mannosaminuronic acid dehydrogenase